jgi:hypothetical protein
MKSSKKKLYFSRVILFVLILELITVMGFYFLNKKENKTIITSPSPTLILSPTPSSMPTKENPKEILPASYKINNVPFTPQAPFANWDFDHNEACEEAAILIADSFYKRKALTPENADKEIMAMVNYQKENWGGHFDLEAKEIAKLAKEYYGYKNPRVIYGATIYDIKKEVAKGNPVIIPTAGRLLKNPYYKQPGPVYHALVAIGYTESEIITNDPGTKRGKDYSYSYATLLNAMHEWNNGNIYNGRRTIIILK